MNRELRSGDHVYVFVPEDPVADRKWDVEYSGEDHSAWAASVKKLVSGHLTPQAGGPPGFAEGRLYQIENIHKDKPYFIDDPCATLKDTDGACVPLRWLGYVTVVPVSQGAMCGNGISLNGLAVDSCDIRVELKVGTLTHSLLGTGIQRDSAQKQSKTHHEAFVSQSKLNDQTIGERDAAREELAQTRVQLAGCLVAADGNAVGSNDAAPGDYGWSPAFEAVKKVRDERDTLLRAAKERDGRSWIVSLRDRIAAEAKDSCAIFLTIAWLIVLLGAVFALLAVDRALRAASWTWSVASMAFNAQVNTAKPISLISIVIGFALAAYFFLQPLMDENERLRCTLNERDSQVAPVRTSTRRWL